MGSVHIVVLQNGDGCYQKGGQHVLSSSHVRRGDLGVREESVPLLDNYGVDLVLCAHDHDKERPYAVRGVLSDSETRTPGIASTESERSPATAAT